MQPVLTLKKRSRERNKRSGAKWPEMVDEYRSEFIDVSVYRMHR